MKFSVCLVVLVTVWQASAQAPGDESNTCENQRGAYPPNTRVLMDSRNYEQLITGSGAVWQALNADGTGSGWRSSFGGLCAAQPRSCDFREGTPQDNWFFTQYIRYVDAREVFVNITPNFQECRLNSECTQLYVDMYRYERDGVDATAARTTTNYQFVRRIEQPSGFSQQQYSASFSFTPTSGNTNGFYLGFRDTGTCVNLQRLQVYYRISPQRIVGLVTYPKVALPRQGSSGSVIAMATCAANSRNLASLQVTCFADGWCVDVASCACVPGHEYVAGTGESGTCRACSPGQFQPYLSNSTNSQCLSCPPNSTSTEPASTVCSCDFGLFRNNSRPEDPCTRPPSSPRIAISRPPTVNGATVEMCWLRSLDNGGSPDLHYNIYVLESGDTEFRRVVTVQPTQSDMVCHSVELNALSSYSVAVTAASGATNDPQNFSDVSVVQDRFILFYVTTCAPVTEPSTVVTCPPTTCPISSPVPTTSSETCPPCPTCEPPPVCNCPTAATTHLTTPPTTPPTTPTTLPPHTVETGTISNIWVVNMEAFWDPPSNSTGKIKSYVVRVQYEKNNGRFAILRRCHINDPAVRKWKPDSMPSQRPLYFQVRVSGSAGNGPWSKRVILAD